MSVSYVHYKTKTEFETIRRNVLGFTLTYIANEIGCSVSTLSNFEIHKIKPGVEITNKINKYFVKLGLNYSIQKDWGIK